MKSTRQVLWLRRIHREWAMLAWMLMTGALSACPVCDTETGQQIRAGIFNAEFGSNLVLVILPFIVMLLVSGLIWRRFPNRVEPIVNDSRDSQG